MHKLIWMFSGQGSQYFGMGRKFFETDGTFAALMRDCDRALNEMARFSLLEVLYARESKSADLPFDYLPHTHPALFCIQYSLAQTLIQRGIKPDLMVGYSLGEWVVAAVSGALPFAVALESIVDQAQLLHQSVSGGAMLAVMSSETLLKNSIPAISELSIAATNFPKHFVLSGPDDLVDTIQVILQSRHISTFRLPVRHAFHSPWMDPIKSEYTRLMHRLSPGSPRISVYSLAKGGMVDHYDEKYFWDVLRQPVGFQTGIQDLERSGPNRYVDLGPSGTLATFLKYTLDANSHSSVYSLMTPFGSSEDLSDKLEQIS